MNSKWADKLFHLNTKIEENNAVSAIRYGLIMMIPLIVLGAFAIMLKSLPIAPYQKFLTSLFNGRIIEILDFIQSGTFNIFAVALSITTSISYATIKNTKVRSERAIVNDCCILAIITLISLIGYMGINKENFSVDYFGTTNTFMGLVIALVSGWLYFNIRECKLMKFITRPETDVDGLYYIAVQSILPAAIVVVFMSVCTQLFSYIFNVETVQEGLEIVMEKLLDCFENGFSAGLVILFFVHFMWFFGIHGSNVLDTVIKNNYTAINDGIIFSKTFQDVFVIMGGCGAVFGLVIAILIFSRKKGMKSVAKLALPSVLFNISELVVLGLPIVFNPTFLIPFILVPVVNHIIAYGAMYLGIVPIVISQVEWTTPVLLSGYQATGSIAGSALQAACLIIDIFIYLPFIRLFELQNDGRMKKQVDVLVEILKLEEETNRVTSLTSREDTLGGVARMLASDLKGAVDKQELYLLYQPQVNVDGECVGAEALLRWEHPIVGFIYPPLIIRLAKEEKFLDELEKFIFDKAAEALSIVTKETSSKCKISVNITNESIMLKDFEETVDRAVKKYDISRDRLSMEITEHDTLDTSLDTSKRLDRLKKAGHKFLIDDFGMGHTSLLYLQTNSFDVVKIDGTVIRGLMNNDRYIEIVKSIIYLGKLLHFRTIAEFVETKEQVELMTELDIDAFQGYYYSKPVPLQELLEWLKEYE